MYSGASPLTPDSQQILAYMAACLFDCNFRAIIGIRFHIMNSSYNAVVVCPSTEPDGGCPRRHPLSSGSGRNVSELRLSSTAVVLQAATVALLCGDIELNPGPSRIDRRDKRRQRREEKERRVRSQSKGRSEERRAERDDKALLVAGIEPNPGPAKRGRLNIRRTGWSCAMKYVHGMHEARECGDAQCYWLARRICAERGEHDSCQCGATFHCRVEGEIVAGCRYFETSLSNADSKDVEAFVLPAPNADGIVRAPQAHTSPAPVEPTVAVPVPTRPVAPVPPSPEPRSPAPTKPSVRPSDLPPKRSSPPPEEPSNPGHPRETVVREDVLLTTDATVDGLNLSTAQLSKALVHAKKLYVSDFLYGYVLLLLGAWVAGFVHDAAWSDLTGLGESIGNSNVFKFATRALALVGGREARTVVRILSGMFLTPLEACVMAAYMYAVSCKGSAHVFQFKTRLVPARSLKGDKVSTNDPRPADRRAQELIQSPVAVNTVHYFYVDHQALIAFYAHRAWFILGFSLFLSPILGSTTSALKLGYALCSCSVVRVAIVGFFFSCKFLAMMSASPRFKAVYQPTRRIIRWLRLYSPARFWLSTHELSYVPAWLDKVCCEIGPNVELDLALSNARIKLLGYMNIAVPDVHHFDLLEGTLRVFSEFHCFRQLGFHVARPLPQEGGRAWF